MDLETREGKELCGCVYILRGRVVKRAEGSKCGEPRFKSQLHRLLQCALKKIPSPICFSLTLLPETVWQDTSGPGLSALGFVPNCSRANGLPSPHLCSPSAKGEPGMQHFQGHFRVEDLVA